MASLEDITVRLIGDTTQYQRSMQEAANVTAATGMTIENVLGAALAANAQQMVTTAAGAAQLTAQVNRLNQSMAEQAATFGMTARQAAIVRLELRGATADELQQARVADALLTRRGLERAELQAQQAAVRSLDAQKTRALEAELRNQERLQQANSHRVQQEIEVQTRLAIVEAQRYNRQQDRQRAQQIQTGHGVVQATFNFSVETARSAIDAYSQFNLALTQTTAIMSINTTEMGEMGKAAIDMSTKTVFSATEIAQAFYYLASAGMTQQQVIKAMPAVLNFATAGMMSVSHAANYAVAAISALGLRSHDPQIQLLNMTRVMDMVTRASKIALGTTEDYARALTRDAATAMRTYNISLEEGIALLTVYHNAGIQGAMAGNMMGRAIRLIFASTAIAPEKQRQLGFFPFDPATGLRKRMPEIIANLRNVLSQYEEEAKPLVLKSLGFETLAQKSILPLIEQAEQLEEQQRKLKQSGGTSEMIAAKQMEAFYNQMQLVINAVKEAAIILGRELAPAAMTIGSVVRGVADTWSGMNAKLRSGIVAALEYGVAFLGLVLVLNQATNAMTLFTNAVVFLSAHPVLAVAAGVAVLTAATIEAIMYFGGLKDAVNDLNDALQKQSELNAKIHGARAGVAERIIERASATPDIGERRKILQDAISSFEKDFTEQQKRLNELRNKRENLGWFTKFREGAASALGAGPSTKEELTTAISDITKHLDISQASAAKLKEALEKVFDLKPKKRTIEVEVQELTAKALKDAANAGLTPNEKTLRELSSRGGDVAGARLAVGYQELQEARAKANKEADHFSQNLAIEAATMGKSKREIEIYKMALDGASQAKLNHAISMAKQADKLEEEHKLFEESRRMVKDLLTPVEQYQEKELEMRKMLDKGYITREQYNLGLQNTAKHLHLGAAASQTFSAALIGSGEAMRRLLHQQEMLEPLGPEGIDPITKSRLPKYKPTYTVPGLLVSGLTKLQNAYPEAFVDKEGKETIWSQMLGFMAKIADNTDKTAKKPGVVAGPP